MSTRPNRGVPPAAWQGPEDKKQQPKTNLPNRLTHRNTDSPDDIRNHLIDDDLPITQAVSDPTAAGAQASPDATAPPSGSGAQDRFELL